MLAVAGLILGYLVPMAALAARPTRERATATVAAVAILGVWIERIALATPRRAPGFALVDLLVPLGVASAGALCVLFALRKARFDDVLASLRTTTDALAH
jgi:hypothetical protein